MAKYICYCAFCEKEYEGNHSPRGWYSLSVSVPKGISHKEYVWLGMYCSIQCLTKDMPKLQKQSDMTMELYQHD